MKNSQIRALPKQLTGLSSVGTGGRRSTGGVAGVRAEGGVRAAWVALAARERGKNGGRAAWAWVARERGKNGGHGRGGRKRRERNWAEGVLREKLGGGSVEGVFVDFE
ncbi:hypothetical protein TIFTF001_050458 [Ficus carica]|uniref:Uncharacterized protein n=1 Tax=Ficus carica TaxID=3494 RepID=A0AA87Z7C0_FICCA|nr:hypothetical protein TIFTF001_050458 [Ficus carica]